jgi:hypothetical protein
MDQLLHSQTDYYALNETAGFVPRPKSDESWRYHRIRLVSVMSMARMRYWNFIRIAFLLCAARDCKVQ